jgi:hypothetical protein
MAEIISVPSTFVAVQVTNPTPLLVQTSPTQSTLIVEKQQGPPGRSVGGDSWDDGSFFWTCKLNDTSGYTAMSVANQGRGSRIRAQKSGMLRNLHIGIGTSIAPSGLLNIEIYDVGVTASGFCSRLYASPTIACPSPGIKLICDPQLAVSSGALYEVWLNADNASMAWLRYAPVLPANTAMPTSLPTSATIWNGVTNGWAFSRNFTGASSYPNASRTVGGFIPFIWGFIDG